MAKKPAGPSLLERMQKAGSVTSAQILGEATFFNDKDSVATKVPALNIALTGSLKGGLTSGVTVIAGPSRSFKTLMSILMLAAYQKKYPEAVCLYFDSEFGSTPAYFEQFGVDISRVIHIPIEHIEQLKFDMVKRLEEIERGDKVFIFIDSIGNLASKKEVEDAIAEKSVADMTRAKAIKSFFRIVTPSITIKDIPCVCVAHTYMEMALFPKAIVGGGTGVMYSPNTVWIISRSQDKNEKTKQIEGYYFTINVEKSRYVREKSKIALKVSFEKGIDVWSGLLEMALESGHVVQIGKSPATYSRVDLMTGEIEEDVYREDDTDTSDFWMPILGDPKFEQWISDRYKLTAPTMSVNIDDDEEQEEAA
jgi:RecA/RadA recombinase